MTNETFDDEALLNEFFNLGYKIPDTLLTNLDRILVPSVGEPFENLGFEIAKRIAKQYGAEITILNNGKIDLSERKKKIEELNIRCKIVNTHHLSNAKAIVEEASKGDYQLVIFSSRRRLKFLDWLITRSTSRRVIPKIKCDVLQVYPKKNEEAIPDFSKIGVMLPRTERDSHLIYWGIPLLSENGVIEAFHFSDFPRITPMKNVIDSDLIVEEKHNFKVLTHGYSALLSTDINPHFILSHSVAHGAAQVMNKMNLGVCFLGQSQKKGYFWRRSLSYKVILKLKSALIIHHYRNVEK